MRPVAVRLALFALAAALTGCFETTSVLTVRADGSGTLREEVQLRGFLRSLAEAEGDYPFFREEAEDRAAVLGEGVELSTYEAEGGGYVATYAVTDVSTLRLSISDIDGFMSELGAGAPVVGDPDVQLAVSRDGGLTTLRVFVPKPAAPKPTPPSEEDGEDFDRATFETLRAAFEDARMRLAIEVEGELVETDAAHVDGNTVTLLDLPIDALFDAAASRPEVLSGADPPSPADLYDLMDEVEGVRVERPGTVHLRFR